MSAARILTLGAILKDPKAFRRKHKISNRQMRKMTRSAVRLLPDNQSPPAGAKANTSTSETTGIDT